MHFHYNKEQLPNGKGSTSSRVGRSRLRGLPGCLLRLLRLRRLEAGLEEGLAREAGRGAGGQKPIPSPKLLPPVFFGHSPCVLPRALPPGEILKSGVGISFRIPGVGRRFPCPRFWRPEVLGRMSSTDIRKQAGTLRVEPMPGILKTWGSGEDVFDGNLKTSRDATRPGPGGGGRGGPEIPMPGLSET